MSLSAVPPSQSVGELSKFLLELRGPLLEHFSTEGPLYQAIRTQLDEQRRRDDAYLGSLGDHERQVELTRRRIAGCEARFRAALDFTPCGCQDDW